MSATVNVEARLSHPKCSAGWLLQLPGPAMALVLQKLDRYSLACTAVTCSMLSCAVLANTSQVAVICRTQQKLDMFIDVLKRHSSSTINLRKCSIFGRWPAAPCLHSLPGPQLEQLRLQSLRVQLHSLDGCPGVLHDCSSLTALDLDWCAVDDVPAAAAAISALTGLRHLRLAYLQEPELGMPLWAELLLSRQLTYFSMGCYSSERGTPREALSKLNQLSELTQLQHLHLSRVHPGALLDGLPSQLVKLTHLELEVAGMDEVAEQLQHLSSLTALQQLSLMATSLAAGIFASCQHLSQLTELKLTSRDLAFNTNSTRSWARLTGLQSLSMRTCTVQPQVLSRLTQLRALSLIAVALDPDTPFQELLAAVSQMTLLTELLLRPPSPPMDPLVLPAAGAYVALTASTNLSSLKLAMSKEYLAPQYSLFKPASVYPNLVEVNLQHEWEGWNVPLSEDGVQQMCSSCPALQSLAFTPCIDTSLPGNSRLLPLLQLTALTRFQAHILDNTTVAAVVHVAAQLTGLKVLVLTSASWELATYPVVLKLATPALAALEVLVLDHDKLRRTVCWGKTSEIWMQLPAFLEKCRLDHEVELARLNELLAADLEGDL